MKNHIFREYDIRGIVGKDLDDSFAYDLGRAYGTLVKKKYGNVVTVGGDVRLSTRDLQKNIILGLASTGMRVINVGRVPTPAQYFSIHHHNADAGIMITGSHNPPDYNGFKMTSKEGSVFGPEIQELKEIISSGSYAKGNGSTEKNDILPAYIERVLGGMDFPRRKKIVLDSGNGAAGLVIEQVFDALNVDPIYLFSEPDGNFPNHHPDPTVPENLTALIAAVKSHDADLGIGFDGDGDRIGVVDKSGNIIWGDRLMILYARQVINRMGNVPIVFDVKCSQALAEEITKAGGTPVMWKTGHSVLKKKMKEMGSPLGGEMSGHIFFGDRYLGYDDAVYAAVRTVEILANSEVDFDELFDGVNEYYASPEIRLDIATDEEKFRIAEKAKTYFSENYDVSDIDGVRIFYGDGWGLVRASNTQPVIVTRFEANSPERLEEIKNSVISKLKEFGEIVD